MGATWYLTRARWRRRWGAQAVLALAIALTGTMVLATAAGARRTETAYERFESESRVPDVFLSISQLGDGMTPDQLAQIRALPQVEGSTVLRTLAISPPGQYQPAAVALDDGWGTTIAIPRYVAGRAPVAADEMAVTEPRADVLGVEVGDTVTMESYSPEQLQAVMGGDDSALATFDGPEIELRVVGIGRDPGSLSTDRDIGSITMVGRPFLDEYGDQVGTWSDLLAISLEGGPETEPAFTDAVHAIPGLEGLQFESGGGVSSNVPDTLTFVARALRILAGIAAIAGVTAIALVLLRIAGAGADDRDTFVALGMGRRARRRLAVVGSLPGVLGGVVLGAIGAVAVSPLFPFGVAGRAEPDPGVTVDLPVLLSGLVLLLVVPFGLAALADRWSDRLSGARSRRTRPSRLGDRLAALGAPYPTVVGTRFVLERDPAGRVAPARTAIAGVAVGVAGLVAVLVFAASRTALTATPAAWGRTWDVAVTEESGGNELIPADEVAARSTVHLTTIQIDGQSVEARGFDAVVGPSMIAVVDGRIPGPNEVVLGASTMDALGVGIGDQVDVAGVSGQATMDVVGQGVFAGISDVPVLDAGAAMDQTTLDRVSDPTADDGFDTDVYRFRPDADQRALLGQLAGLDEGTPVAIDHFFEQDRPDEFDRLDEVWFLPWVLAGFLGLLAVTATTALLVSAVQRRRHDLAVLRAEGLAGRGVRAIVAAQATTVSALGLLVGVPVGIMIGRLVWGSVAEGLGVAAQIDLPWLLLLATAVAVLVVDLVVSLLPAERAARTRPAAILRSE